MFHVISFWFHLVISYWVILNTEWWKKSCISWSVVYPLIFAQCFIPPGTGCLPSTMFVMSNPYSIFQTQTLIHMSYIWIDISLFGRELRVMFFKNVAIFNHHQNTNKLPSWNLPGWVVLLSHRASTLNLPEPTSKIHPPYTSCFSSKPISPTPPV